MTASNPELVRSLEQRIANDKAAHLRGWARIHLSHLEFLDPIREEDKRIAAELSRHIAAEGCHDEKYPIAAIIDDDILQTALREAGIAPDSLGKASLSNPPKLKLSNDTKLACLDGLHRKLAARQVLPPVERWTVELYDKGLGSDARQSLRDGYSYSANYTDGEIFRHIRECQLAGDKVGEGRWKARYSPTKERDFKQLLKRPILLSALDSIRPVRGLWGGFHAGSLDILLTSRCDEEIAHYIKGIEELFNRVFDGDTSLMELTDNFTIEEIQLRAPALSSYDAEYIQSQMTSKSKRFFPKIGDPSVRAGITSRLMATENFIPTISTLFKDLRYLQPALKMIRGLIPKIVDKTLRQALFSRFPQEPEDSLEIQVSEHSYSTYSGSSGQFFDVAIRQLFLYAIRHSAKPPGQRADIYSIFGLAEFASRLGFFSDEITMILKNDPYQNVVLDLLCRILPTRKAADTQMRTQPVIRELRELVDALSTTAVEPLAPWATVPGLGEPISRRSGVAVWVPPSDGMGSESEDLNQMFLRQMNLPLSSLQRGGEGISSFYVKRSIYLRFFGVSTLDGHSSPHPRNNVEGWGQPSHRDLPSNHSAEQATAPDPALRVSSRERNINQEVRTVERMIIFLENNVQIREVPYEKDRVNFQAREYADQGKKLHIPEGAHFVWEHCFDILSRTGSSTVIVSTINHPKNRKRPHYQAMPGQFPPSTPAGNEGN